MTNFMFSDDLGIIDPHVQKIIEFERERQRRKLIMIPSESSAPLAIRQAMSSELQNLYAEGYPDEEWRHLSEEEIVDYEKRLAHYRRYSNGRYYKGTEFADFIESLARRRCAELFCADPYSPEDLYVNVQPLSGAPANNAVYQALIKPNDSIMGMSLFHGGHLTHGSSVNRSGKLYQVVHYSVDPDTEQIDYDNIQNLADENKPKVIIAGYSSYPWIPNWKKFREIADSVGAYLFADIAHIAGLIAAKVVPSPIGYADVITFTTHKTLCGPRGACIITTNPYLSQKIDRAVFPGEQGGPHVQIFAGMATAFHIAKSKQFIKLQEKIISNCKTLSDTLSKKDLRIAYGGTNSHLLNIDCKSIKGSDGTTLSGDMAARILEIAGIDVNRNTIPSDSSALNASGIRMGTPWVTQLGMIDDDMVNIANIIADVLHACSPYSISGSKGIIRRAKIQYDVLENAKIRIRELLEKFHTEKHPIVTGYPQQYFLDDYGDINKDCDICFKLHGDSIRQFLNFTVASDIESLEPSKYQNIIFYADGKEIIGKIFLEKQNEYLLVIDSKDAGVAATWLRGLSDGYIYFDSDLKRRIPGPITIIQDELPDDFASKIVIQTDLICNEKPFFIGKRDENNNKSLPDFEWEENVESTLKRTPLYDWHVKSGAKIVPFAGWEMPVWYSSVVEEHLATRKTAGIFDVTHMGVFQAEGQDAVVFLDGVCANDISNLNIGQSCYTHFLDPYANVIDDLLVYRFDTEKFLVVVNAANEEKDWAWLQAVKNGFVNVENHRHNTFAFGRGVLLRNLRDIKEGKDRRVDIALQGHKSREILLNLPMEPSIKKKINNLQRTELCVTPYKDNNIIISRTGYTGESIAFELFVHPDLAISLWSDLIAIGGPLGMKPCGLGARDSLRTEAGLPLYGHEMGGELNFGVGEAGFETYVKTYKPWFVGRTSFIEKEEKRNGHITRFRFDDKRVRMAHLGDPVLDERGKVIGIVTSCAIDTEEYLTGQAYLEEKYTQEGQKIFIYQHVEGISEITPAVLKMGARITLPNQATVLRKFPKL